jgi:hypothetical protein
MRRLHLIVGHIVVLAFIASGQIMAHHEPHMAALSPEVRLLFRSRHIYLLAGALVNLMAGLYLQLRPAGWRRVLQLTGSVFLLLAPVLLLIAFLTEPQYGLRGTLRFGRGGILAMALGTLAHLLSGVGRY